MDVVLDILIWKKNDYFNKNGNDYNIINENEYVLMNLMLYNVIGKICFLI